MRWLRPFKSMTGQFIYPEAEGRVSTHRAVRTAKGTTHLVTSYATKGHETTVAETACGAWLSPSILEACDVESINDLGACRLCYKIWKERKWTY